MAVRMQEHTCHTPNGRADISAVAEHAVAQSHEIDWATTKVIDSATNTNMWKVKEALHIARKAPNMLTMHPVSVHSYRIKRTVLACVLCLT